MKRIQLQVRIPAGWYFLPKVSNVTGQKIPEDNSQFFVRITRLKFTNIYTLIFVIYCVDLQSSKWLDFDSNNSGTAGAGSRQRSKVELITTEGCKIRAFSCYIDDSPKRGDRWLFRVRCVFAGLRALCSCSCSPQRCRGAEMLRPSRRQGRAADARAGSKPCLWPSPKLKAAIFPSISMDLVQLKLSIQL